MKLKKGQSRWVVYPAKNKKWYWHQIAANYRKVAASEQGYSSRKYAINDALRAGGPKELGGGYLMPGGLRVEVVT